MTKHDTTGARKWTVRLGTTANDTMNAVAVDGAGFPWGVAVSQLGEVGLGLVNGDSARHGGPEGVQWTLPLG